MNSKKDGKKIRRLQAGAAVMAILTVGLWLVILSNEASIGPVSPGFFITLAPLACILALLVVVVRRQEAALKSGMPLADERSGAIDNKAGRYTVTFVTWFLLASAFYQMFMEELHLPDILLRHYIWVTFFLTMFVFVGLKWYFSRD